MLLSVLNTVCAERAKLHRLGLAIGRKAPSLLTAALPVAGEENPGDFLGPK